MLHIPYTLWAYKTAPHVTIGESPLFLIYRRDPVNLVVRVRQWVQEYQSLEKNTNKVTNRLL
mgnify:CR=1 FL=1